MNQVLLCFIHKVLVFGRIQTNIVGLIKRKVNCTDRFSDCSSVQYDLKKILMFKELKLISSFEPQHFG